MIIYRDQAAKDKWDKNYGDDKDVLYCLRRLDEFTVVIDNDSYNKYIFDEIAR